MASVDQWHASPDRGRLATGDSSTGEIRVPLSLFHVDEHQGDVELVLSRVEAERLQATLTRMLTSQPVAVPSGR